MTAWCGGRSATKKRELDNTEPEKNQMPDRLNKPELKPKPQRKLDAEPEKNQITSQATPQPKSKQRSKHPSATQTPEKKLVEKQTLKIEFEDAKNVPLMFQAQIPDRGNIQYVGEENKKQKRELENISKPQQHTKQFGIDNKKNKNQEGEKEKPAYERWVMQWLEGCPPAPEKVDEKHRATQRCSAKSTIKLPQFGSNVKSWEYYQIRWRMVTNGGQDEGLIRPVIGAKGMPFFPGSSMKGAFLRACPEDKRQQYCGGEILIKGEKRTKPGILRFHGGYPVDMSWAQCDRLVDIAHGQQPYQVMRNTKEKGENANVQISLYQPKFKFGISSTKILEDSEWTEIQLIWEKALGRGIGSRVSAGYGYIDRVNNGSLEPIENCDRILLSIHLNGQGLASQLLLKNNERDKHKTPEFRPNMFKAALRGHTLRLLGGIADEKIAQDLTKKLWGGIPEKGEYSQEIVSGGEITEQREDQKPKAIVGSIGIHFTVDGKLCTKGKHTYKQVNKFGKLSTPEMPTYNLENGTLNLLKIGEVKPEIEQFIINLVKFSVLLGGFGKSWRRTHHKLFYPSYFENDDKPMIGCHWEFARGSEGFYIPANDDLSKITEFINNIREDAIAWVRSEVPGYQPNSYVRNWREAWHPNKVQVWGRFAENGKSQAVQWFHETNRLKDSSLAGKMGQIGRTWHRMYPRYIIEDGKLTRLENEYLELLTIFPDESDKKSQQFMDFLSTKNSGFQQIY